MAKNTLFPIYTALLLSLTAIITTLTTRCAHAAPYSEPTLTIHYDSKTSVLSLTELQQRSDRETLVLAADPVYGDRVLSYTAIPIHKLFEGFHVPSDSTLLFTCLDGFSAPLSAQKLLNSSPSTGIAYLAIEDPEHPWPTIKDGKTAGPFYIVWKTPPDSQINREEWPYQVVSFEISRSLREIYPAIFPDSSLPSTSPEWRGVSVFTTYCFACHTMNGSGSSQLGPDLNIPHNPTEYLRKEFLISLIRNPQSVRRWPQSKMLGFSENELSAEKLMDLLSYLEHMATRKQPSS